MSGEQEVRDLYARWLKCWNERDAAGMAALLSPSASMVGFDGSQMNGPAEIVATLGHIFANHPTAAYVSIVREVRVLTPDVLLLCAVAGMVPPGRSDINPAVNAIQSLVAVRYDRALRMELFQNTPAAFHGRPELVDALSAELRAAMVDSNT